MRHEADTGNRRAATVHRGKHLGANAGDVNPGHRSDSGYESFQRDLYQGRCGDRAAALPELSSAGRGHTVLDVELRRSAALGDGDEAHGGNPRDASLV